MLYETPADVILGGTVPVESICFTVAGLMKVTMALPAITSAHTEGAKVVLHAARKFNLCGGVPQQGAKAMSGNRTTAAVLLIGTGAGVRGGGAGVRGATGGIKHPTRRTSEHVTPALVICAVQHEELFASQEVQPTPPHFPQLDAQHT